MDKQITLVVFRFDPEKDTQPYFVEYPLDTDREWTVLILLNRIQSEMDQTLSFRSYCCGLQMCRSCLVKINHKRQLACLTLAKPGDRIVIEPATFPENHIKDLVVKRTREHA